MMIIVLLLLLLIISIIGISIRGLISICFVCCLKCIGFSRWVWGLRRGFGVWGGFSLSAGFVV